MTTTTKTQPSNLITKQFNLAEFKTVDEGDGKLIGHPSVAGNLDDVGDVILSNGYDDLSKFVGSGWLASEHEWGFSKEIGIVLKASEDTKGLFVEFEFHSTPAAQSIRQIVAKRIKHGKAVPMSIGYVPVAQPIYIYPNQYDRELLKYLKPQFLKAGLAKARQFDRIRILPKVKVYEGSVVQVPANAEAAVVGVKAKASAVSSATASHWLLGLREARKTLLDYQLKSLGKTLEETDDLGLYTMLLQMETLVREINSELANSPFEKARQRKAQREQQLARLQSRVAAISKLK